MKPLLWMSSVCLFNLRVLFNNSPGAGLLPGRLHTALATPAGRFGRHLHSAPDCPGSMPDLCAGRYWPPTHPQTHSSQALTFSSTLQILYPLLDPFRHSSLTGEQDPGSPHEPGLPKSSLSCPPKEIHLCLVRSAANLILQIPEKSLVEKPSVGLSPGSAQAFFLQPSFSSSISPCPLSSFPKLNASFHIQANKVISEHSTSKSANSQNSVLETCGCQLLLFLPFEKYCYCTNPCDTTSFPSMGAGDYVKSLCDDFLYNLCLMSAH